MLLRLAPLLLCSLLCATATLVSAADTNSRPVFQVFQKGLALRSVGRAERSVVHTDAIEEQIISGHWHPPTLGETVTGASGTERTWETVEAGKEDWFEGGAARGGYIYCPVVSDREQVLVLEAAGHNLAYVNGEPRTGDPYAYGYVHLPVRLHPGTNDFLFQCARGRLRARLTIPDAPIQMETADLTLPDLVVSRREPIWGAVVLLNVTTNTLKAGVAVAGNTHAQRIVTIPPLSLRKAPFLVTPPRTLGSNNLSVRLETLVNGKVVAKASIELRVRQPGQTYKRTFVSSLDDSVQYYAVNPAWPPTPSAGGPALFLSVHGASVEAIGQADAYYPKPSGPIVCPTNRRPYGFDWEEWGRMDALEVLALAKEEFHPDPARIYLTGHSMGGHGTWQLGALFPDLFAAIGPSAGWISFTSYVQTNRPASTNAIEKMLLRAAATSDTLLMASNYLHEGVYIIHGADDDNVPVREARHMVNVLGGFHHDFVYHEQPGAGHWWDVSDEPGADCVDWLPLFDFFAHHEIPTDRSLRHIQFTTVNPAVSSRSHWVTILGQQHALEPSSVDVQCDPGKRRLVGTTANVSCLLFELPLLEPGKPVSLVLDGQKLENLAWPNTARTPTVPIWGSSSRPFICLKRDGEQWRVGEPLSSKMKNPARSGPFRQAFCNHMIFVYGTRGSAEETAANFNKARYDAETFYYRGNGSVEMLPDNDVVSRLRSQRNKTKVGSGNFIVYGNADNNGAWPLLLADSPVQVRRGAVQLGSRTISGDNLACLFLRPLPGDDAALVGVVAGSSVAGQRLSERMAYFLSGSGFPDCLVASSEMLTKGIAGVRAAGFFGGDWGVESGDFAWSE